MLMITILACLPFVIVGVVFSVFAYVSYRISLNRWVTCAIFLYFAPWLWISIEVFCVALVKCIQMFGLL